MTTETVKDIVKWLQNFRKEPVTFTFHGGEPLLAGADFFRKALPTLADGLHEQGIAFALQTNLWKMTPEIAQILAEYNIPIGSSIDGPQELTDFQRGEGYYEKTMAGYEIAKANGLNVSFICTFTSHSVKFKEDIFKFFLDNGLNLKLHPALPSLRDDNPEKWALPPEEYGELLVYLLDQYLKNLNRIQMMNIDNLCQCYFGGRGTVCTFVDCMGDTFAVGPDGSIYPCYRFVGMLKYVMGNVRDQPTVEDLAKSESWKLMFQFKDYVDKECGDCTHIKYCRGGCPYNAIAPTEGEVKGVDPHCIAYKRIFEEIVDQANEELFGGSAGSGPAMFGFGAGAPSSSSGKAGIMDIVRKHSTPDEVQY